MKITFGTDGEILPQGLGKHDMLTARAFGPESSRKTSLPTLGARRRTGGFRSRFFLFKNSHSTLLTPTGLIIVSASKTVGYVKILFETL